MKEVSRKGELFYRNWEKQRTKKWRYVFYHGILYFGVPVAIISLLVNSVKIGDTWTKR